MPLTLQKPLSTLGGLRVGIDTIDIADVAASLHHFGSRYTQRLFTAAELDYALAVPALAPERLAARFAAKEAAIKLLNLGQLGLNWRDIEVLRDSDGACRLAWHGLAAQQLAALPPGDIALSLSHDSAHAVAVVVMLPLAVLTPTSTPALADGAVTVAAEPNPSPSPCPHSAAPPAAIPRPH